MYLFKFYFKEFKNKDILNFINLSKKFYNKSKNICDPKFVKWKYITNLKTITKIFFIKKKNKLIGRVALNPKKIAYGKKKINSYNLSDLIIEKKIPFLNFRKLILLPNMIVKKNFIIHGSNEISKPLYEKIFNFPVYFNLSINFFPIRLTTLNNNIDIFTFIYKKFIKSLIKLLNIINNQKIYLVRKSLNKENINKIQSRLINCKFPQFEKDVDFYSWRYSIYDPNDLSFYFIMKNNNLLGFIIFVESIYKNKKITIAHDFNLFGKINKFENFLLKINLIKEVLDSVNSLALIIFGNSKSPIVKMVTDFPFIKFPNFLLPHNSVFFGRKTNTKIKNIKKFHITMADIDYF